ncbi:MAG: hypothetical protein IJY77_03305 [Alphaproteobacteria bacterium]|nr:hypothetical protein [Alphaproteobacteria bacterium]
MTRILFVIELTVSSEGFMMLWLFNCVFILLFTYLFGTWAGVLCGIYMLAIAFLIARYNRFAVQVIDKQRQEIEKLRKK